MITALVPLLNFILPVVSQAVYCNEPSETGPCNKYTINWYFSQQDGRCRRFWYGGCKGNQNNFKDKADCDAVCKRSTRIDDLCLLPQVTGPCKASNRRWFYDESTGSCRAFTYGGCRGNQNRFLTKTGCIIRCGSGEVKLKINQLRAIDKSWNRITLEWKPPVMVKDITQYRLLYARVRYRGNQIQHDSVNVIDISGNTSSFSINGLQPATQYKFNLTAITSNGKRGPTEQLITDTITQTKDRLCLDTAYGCCVDGKTTAKGPNYDGCPEACQVSEFGCCEDGIYRATGPNQHGCEVSSGDEDLYCKQFEHRCCADGITKAQGPNKEGCMEYVPLTPKLDPDGPCQQSQERGPCSDYEVKVFYNTTSGQCQRFWYGGCQGNQNNFDSDEDCEAACVQKKTLPLCEQPKEAGPCRNLFLRFYFNKDTRRCETFAFGGCAGNDNNFKTKIDCLRRCKNKCDEHPERGPCLDFTVKWFFNRTANLCQRFWYGGCGGNDNRFNNLKTCKTSCTNQETVSQTPEETTFGFTTSTMKTTASTTETMTKGAMTTTKESTAVQNSTTTTTTTAENDLNCNNVQIECPEDVTILLGKCMPLSVPHLNSAWHYNATEFKSRFELHTKDCQNNKLEKASKCMEDILDKCKGTSVKEKVLQKFYEKNKVLLAFLYYCTSLSTYERNAQCISLESLKRKNFEEEEYRRLSKIMGLLKCNVTLQLVEICRADRTISSDLENSVLTHCGKEAADFVKTIHKLKTPSVCGD